MELSGQNELTLRGYLPATPRRTWTIEGQSVIEFGLQVYRPAAMSGFAATCGARDDAYDLLTVRLAGPRADDLLARWKRGWSVRLCGRLTACDGSMGGGTFLLAETVEFLTMLTDEMAAAGTDASGSRKASS